MAINMPHEGGKVLLRNFFGTGADPSGFRVAFYKAAFTTGDTYNDDDDATSTDLFEAETGNEQWVTCITIATSTGFDIVTKATLQANNLTDAKIISAGVPQIEFPEVKLVFESVPTGITTIHGYAVCTVDGSGTRNEIVFREKFTSPFTIAANAVLQFIPVMRIGNTTCTLT